MVARNWRGGQKGSVFSEYEVLGLEDEKVLEIDGGDDCTRV